MKRRYPFVPVLVIILQVLAVLVLIALAVPGIIQIPETFKTLSSPAAAGAPLAQKIGFLMQPFIAILLGIGAWALTWALADGLSALREIEFNTRAVAPTALYAAPEKDTKAGGDITAE